MLASVWSSSVLSLVRQYMTCSTCSYEAQWGSFLGITWGEIRASFLVCCSFLLEPVVLSHYWLPSRLSVAVMLPEEAVRGRGRG